MEFMNAFAAMLEGKKISRPCWERGYYWRIGEACLTHCILYDGEPIEMAVDYLSNENMNATDFLLCKTNDAYSSSGGGEDEFVSL